MRMILCAALLLAAAADVGAQNPPTQPPSLTVNATGTVEREPEQGVALLAVESEAATAKAAAEANAAKMAQLLPALHRSGVQPRNIRTVSYQLHPEYTQSPRGGEPPRITRYRASNMVSVTVDTVARLGGIIDVAIGSGANRVASIHFQLRDQHAAHVEAARMAMRNARREAEAIAEAAGERLGPALSIQTGGYSAPPVPMYARAVDMVETMAAVTPIEGGTLAVTASVTVVYELLRGPR